MLGRSDEASNLGAANGRVCGSYGPFSRCDLSGGHSPWSFEPTELVPPHWEAGAGSYALILRFFLALTMSVSMVILAVVDRGLLKRVILAIFAVLPMTVFIQSVSFLEREAPDFNEQAFTRVMHQHLEGQSFSKSEVLLLVGPPLIDATSDQGGCWSYTYTPSGGFGFRKRMFCFDDQDQLVDHSWGSEP